MPTSPGSQPIVLMPSRGGSEKETFQTRELAIVFTDINDSVAYFAKHGDAAGARMIRACNEVLCDVARGFGGTVAHAVGDSVISVFANARDAAFASGAMQSAISKMNEGRTEVERIAISAGLSFGPTIIDAHDVFGDPINVASRLKGLAARDQVVMSEAFKEQLDPDAPCKVRFVGNYVLRGLEKNLRVYELVWNDVPNAIAPTPQLTFVPDFAVVPEFQLQQIHSDGSVSREFDIVNQLAIGRSEGDLNFPSDLAMSPLHARFCLQGCQIYVEECGAGPVFCSVSSACALKHGDVVKIGTQLFEFNSESSAPDSANSPPSHEPQLVSVRDRNKTFRIESEGITVGRTTGTYIFQDDALMSRTHAKLFFQASTVYIEDLASRNGTYIRVRGRVPIAPGTKILAGAQILRLSIQERGRGIKSV